MSWALKAEGLSKDFRLHLQGGIRIPVLDDVSLTVNPGECVALVGELLLRVVVEAKGARERIVRGERRGVWVPEERRDDQAPAQHQAEPHESRDALREAREHVRDPLSRAHEAGPHTQA